MKNFHKGPCYGCERRHQGCHSTCPDGLAQDERNRKIRDAKKEERELAGYYAQQQWASDRSKWEMKRNGVR